MARFRFSLQALLDLRAQEERARRLALGEAERERLAIEETLRGYQASIESMKDDLRGTLDAGAGIDPKRVRLQANATMHLRVKAQALAVKLAGAYERAERERERLREAVARRRAVERLRERRLEAWKRGVEKREAMALDELATMRFDRDGEAL